VSSDRGQSGGSLSRPTVVVVAGGSDPPTGVEVPPDAVVIAADGGVGLAQDLGLAVDLIVGDLDSVSTELLAAGARTERHPEVKEASDLDLALAAALRLKPDRIVVLSGAGGRLDHLLGALLLLAADPYRDVEVDAQLGAALVHVVRGERRLVGAPGELISLFALHGPAEGVSTDGLVYRLDGETLAPGSSRGLSNLFAAPEARIRVKRGVLLAVRPTGSGAGGSSHP
jgi:thiamine pyrophosphokinase